MIDVTHMEPAEVFRRLYNRAKPQGMGILHYDPKPLSLEEARSVLEARKPHKYFDYFRGRVMKVEIGSSIDPRLYDRDNGTNAALDALTEPEG